MMVVGVPAGGTCFGTIRLVPRLKAEHHRKLRCLPRLANGLGSACLPHCPLFLPELHQTIDTDSGHKHFTENGGFEQCLHCPR